MAKANFQWANDLGAPVAVAAVDIITKETKPEWNEYVSYGMAAAGYLSAVLGFGGEFMKQVGVAALPGAIANIYARVKSPAATERRASSRLSFAPVRSRVGQTTFPELETVRVS